MQFRLDVQLLRLPDEVVEHEPSRLARVIELHAKMHIAVTLAPRVCIEDDGGALFAALFIGKLHHPAHPALSLMLFRDQQHLYLDVGPLRLLHPRFQCFPSAGRRLEKRRSLLPAAQRIFDFSQHSAQRLCARMAAQGVGQQNIPLAAFARGVKCAARDPRAHQRFHIGVHCLAGRDQRF